MSEPYIGEIRAFAFSFAPQGWLACNGELLNISDYPTLYSLLGTTYGGDGAATFALPDLRGRTAVHTGQGTGLSERPLGMSFGSENTVLIEDNLPAHNHNVSAQAGCIDVAGNSNKAKGNIWAQDAGPASITYSTSAPNTYMSSSAIAITESDAGIGAPCNNMPPALVVNYCIAVVGTYPPRP